jgi:serine/threonine-protein kinase
MVLGALAVLVLVLGITLPFVISTLRFGGSDGLTLTTPTSTPTASDASESPTSEISESTDGVIVPLNTLTGPEPVTATPRPASGTTRPTSTTRTTTTPPRPTSTKPTKPTKTRTTSTTTTTRPGQVYVDAATYLGRPYAEVNAALRALGLTSFGRWIRSPQPFGTVVGVRPTGWVPRGSTVQLSVSRG